MALYLTFIRQSLILRQACKVFLGGYLILMLTACGGGGGGDESSVVDNTSAPLPVAGGDSKSNPVNLQIDTNYSISIAVAGNKYYTFTTGNRASTFTMDLSQVSTSLSWTLYTDSGFNNFIDICNQSYDSSDCETDLLDANTTYYFSLSQFSAATANFILRINQNITSEGTFFEPVRIEVGTPYEGTVGAKLYTLNEVSYYDFVVNTSIEHTISITGATTDLLWKLDVSGGGLYTEVVSCDEVWVPGDESCSTPVLNATTRYILRVENVASEGTLFTINVTEGGTPPADLPGEGSLLSPFVLIPDQPYIGTVSKNGTNYYKFTTGDISAVHIINLQHVSTSLQFYLYTDSSFSAKIDAHYQGLDFRDIDFRTTFLDPNTTYYLEIINFSDIADKYNITVLVDALRDVNSEGTTFTPIPLTLDINHSGKVGASGVSYYSFTAVEAKPYLISTKSTTSDIYWTEQKDRSLYATRTSCNKVSDIGDEICPVLRTNVGDTYLIDVRENDGVAATYNMLITTIEGEGEGTRDTPVTITVDTPYLSSLGVNERSFYKFTTGSEPLAYRVSISAATSDTDWEITQVGSYSKIKSCDRYRVGTTTPTADEICDTPILLPNTEYLLTVDENDGAKTDITVLVSSIPAIELPLDTPVSTAVGDYTEYRYHKFTTDAINTDYTVTINNAVYDVQWVLYDDAAYSVYNQDCRVEPGHSYLIGCTLTGLSPNTTHYIRTYSYKPQLSSDSYDMAVYADDFIEGDVTPVGVTLGVEHIGKMQGTDAGTAVQSVYQFTTTSGGGPKPHTITVTSQLVGTVSLYEGSTYETGCTMTPGMTRVCPTIAATPITLRANTLYTLYVDNYYRTQSSEFVLKVDVAP